MSERSGTYLENAIVLDDEEPEELGFVDLSDFQPRAKVTPILPVNCNMLSGPLLTVARRSLPRSTFPVKTISSSTAKTL